MSRAALASLGAVRPARSTHERIVATAVELTGRVGWARVTMAVLADEVGVSRQTVYNELGSRAGLAEAMVERELALFLELVTGAFDDHPDDVVLAVGDAAEQVLRLAHDNPLLHAVVSATHGADTELLPLLTTHSAPLLEVAKAAVADRLATYDLPLSEEQAHAAIDMVVRVVLSHVMQPSGDPADTAVDIAWVAARVLR